MEFVRIKYTVKNLVATWETGLLVRNPEYQRGEAWSTAQKQALIDSIFRKYPIPAIFLEKKVLTDLLSGEKSNKYEIIDGQQRILALVAFLSQDFALLDPKDKKLRLPDSLRAQTTPWSGRRCNQLDADLRQQLEGAELDVYQVTDVENSDEVRDLFIRLQSGTALTRQQIRDAWPGKIGPIIEGFSGKLSKQPKFSLFSVVDGRGTRDDEDDPRDRYVKHRQTCAQLLRVLVARSSAPSHFPSVLADDIDAFYHDQTNIDPDGELVQRLDLILTRVEKVTDVLGGTDFGRRKLPKVALFALALFQQDMATNPSFKFDNAAIKRLAEYIAKIDIKVPPRSMSGPNIEAYYDKWKANLPEGIGIQLDPKRLFDADDRKIIWKKTDGKCGFCSGNVVETDAEYDHYPVPYFMGGKTLPGNGRLVHRTCHPRGHPDVLRKGAA